MVIDNFNLIKIAILFIAAVCCIKLGISPAYAEIQCINSLPSDSSHFGDILAGEDKYLVVGDPWANRVVVYTREQDNKWLRTREILPPKNSTSYKVGSGFGHTIALDGDTLIIGTFTVIKPENTDAVNSQDIQEDNGLFSTSTVLYQTKLDKQIKVNRIDLPDLPIRGVIPNNTVVADRGKIGFIFSQQQPRKNIKRVNQVYVLSNGKSYALRDGKLESRSPSNVSRFSIYGADIALKNNLLLVSIDPAKGKGGVWLFDLNSLQNKPQKITPSYTEPAIITVAISEQFIAIGNTFTSSNRDSSKPYQTTQIINITTGSAKVIDRSGGVSLDGNILNITHSISDERNAPVILEVFKLDNDATPHLIQKYSDIESSSLLNGLLITARQTASGRRICTERTR